MNIPEFTQAADVMGGLITANSALIALGGILMALNKLLIKTTRPTQDKLSLRLVALSLYFGVFGIYNFIGWYLAPSSDAMYVGAQIATAIQAGFLLYPITNLAIKL